MGALGSTPESSDQGHGLVSRAREGEGEGSDDAEETGAGEQSESERWIPVTAEAILDCGFTDFAWVTPSEILGDHIFTNAVICVVRPAPTSGWEN